jgi:uncharacterized protein involved in response to NO
MNKFNSVFSISFRPFFVLAALIAFINPIIWIMSYLDGLSLSLNAVSPLFWHGHEMIFGFSGALIAGFILTASANWTSTAPYQGRPLIMLSGLWILERVSYFLPINNHIQFIVMNLFFPALVIMLFIKLKNFKKQRNVFIPILFGITLAKLLHSYGYIYSFESIETSGKEVAIGLVRLIVLLIAGRVIPFFTRKKIEGVQIDLPSWINPVALLPIILLTFPWPEATPKIILMLIYIFAILGNTLRQSLWKPLKSIKVPILFILHIGVFFVNLGLVLEFLSLFIDQLNYSQATLHMFVAGGLGVVGIGIMTRVTLGHTGRVIKADKWTVFAYLCIIIGSILRVFVPILMPELYVRSLHMTAGFWSLGFFIFMARYLKVLILPRPDGKA